MILSSCLLLYLTEMDWYIVSRENALIHTVMLATVLDCDRDWPDMYMYFVSGSTFRIRSTVFCCKADKDKRREKEEGEMGLCVTWIQLVIPCPYSDKCCMYLY